MSGGVDSSTALYLTKKNNPTDKILGVTLALTENCAGDGDNIADAKAAAQSQGVEHTHLYAYPQFRQAVIDYFTSSYLAGLTPNPCVICNREIKFGLLLDYAIEQGFDRVATGHYVKTEQIGEYVYIKRARDLKKDQSYVLAMLSQSQLRRAYFPLGDLTKDEVKQIAAQQNLVAQKNRKESQDICFIPDGDYVSFMKNAGIILPSEGNYVDGGGKIMGKHKGHVNYTIGQRKKLGISVGEHIFVLSKDAEKNEVVLGSEDSLYKKQVHVTGLNLPSDPHALDGEVKVSAKLRYAHKPADAVFVRVDETSGILTFAEPQRAPSPGQFAVIYSEKAEVDPEAVVLGGGVIADSALG